MTKIILVIFLFVWLGATLWYIVNEYRWFDEQQRYEYEQRKEELREMLRQNAEDYRKDLDERARK